MECKVTLSIIRQNLKSKHVSAL